MADFSLTTLFVVPVGNTLPSSGSTQNLLPGQFGLFLNTYAVANTGNIGSAPYFYAAQGRTNTYLQGSKRSDKISASNVTEWYKVTGNPVAANQVTDVSDFTVKPGEIVTLTLRGFSNYINTLYFNGFTRSVTVNAPCLACGGDPCTDVDVPALIDDLIYHLELKAPGNNPDNISFCIDASNIQLGSYRSFSLIEQSQQKFQMDKMNFESWVTDGTVYDTYYIKFNEYDKSAYQWGDYIHEDSTVIIAAPQSLAADIEDVLIEALGLPTDDSGPITSTTSTTTTIWPSTSTTTTLIP